MGEKRISCMEFDSKRERLITCSSVISCYPLAKSIQDTMQIPRTHEKPLTGLVYSMSQMATICAESTIKLWETETGKPITSIQRAHGTGVDVTSASCEKSGHRMVTGGSDGSIKIWDFCTGQELKSLKMSDGVQHAEGDSIRHLNYLRIDSELLIMAFTDSNEIKIYSDSSDSVDLKHLRTLNNFSSLIIDPKLNNGIGEKLYSFAFGYIKQINSTTNATNEPVAVRIKSSIDLGDREVAF